MYHTASVETGNRANCPQDLLLVSDFESGLLQGGRAEGLTASEWGEHCQAGGHPHISSRSAALPPAKLGAVDESAVGASHSDYLGRLGDGGSSGLIPKVNDRFNKTEPCELAGGTLSSRAGNLPRLQQTAS